MSTTNNRWNIYICFFGGPFFYEFKQKSNILFFRKSFDNRLLLKQMQIKRRWKVFRSTPKSSFHFWKALNVAANAHLIFWRFLSFAMVVSHVFNRFYDFLCDFEFIKWLLVVSPTGGTFNLEVSFRSQGWLFRFCNEFLSSKLNFWTLNCIFEFRNEFPFWNQISFLKLNFSV